VRSWAEVRNLLEIAELILRSAHFRTESRGGHYRSDYPETDPAWQVHTLVQRNHWWTGVVDSTSF
ncbi:MAG: L-aspartate oxidase, partial [Oscillatoriales cyanobacterium C42_A2020_001]|nr:L-aspartate oxidase [Leptolyngbyaceae cyanobacterium C42_A2020_001]